MTRWPWKSIGFQILLRTKYALSVVKFHWRSVHKDVTEGRKEEKTDGSVTISLRNFVGEAIINREQRICRQCYLNVIEDEEHFFFHCQKNELRKEFLTQIENLYTKLMENNHIQNLDFFYLLVFYATCCPFHSKVISTEESGINIAA